MMPLFSARNHLPWQRVAPVVLAVCGTALPDTAAAIYGLESLRVNRTCTYVADNVIGAPRRLSLKPKSKIGQPIGTKVYWNSSNPALLPVPSASVKDMVIGVNVAEPRQITPVMVMAHMLPKSIDQKQLPLVIYPKLKIASVQILPQKSIYRVGDKVTIRVSLNFKPPARSVEHYRLQLTRPVTLPPLSARTIELTGWPRNGFPYSPERWDLKDGGRRVFEKSFTIGGGSWTNVGSHIQQVSMGVSASMEYTGSGIVVTDCPGQLRIIEQEKKLNFAVKNPNASQTNRRTSQPVRARTTTVTPQRF